MLLVAETQEPGHEPLVNGLVLVWCIADEAQVLELAVHPRAMRQGLGLQLMTEALAISLRSAMHHLLAHLQCTCMCLSKSTAADT